MCIHTQRENACILRCVKEAKESVFFFFMFDSPELFLVEWI